MRNLNNLNHWIAELRRIAWAKNVSIVNSMGDTVAMTMDQVRSYFCAKDYRERFDDGYTPQEAYELTLDEWQEAENAYCQSASG